MKAHLLDHFRRFTLAYLLAGLFFLMSSGTQFVDTFVALTREQCAALAWWQILALFWKSIMSGFAAVVAFLNQHISRVPPKGEEPDPILPPPAPAAIFDKLPESARGIPFSPHPRP